MIPGLFDKINSFNSIKLTEVDRYRLMDRIDTKYLFNADRITELLDLLTGKYRILEINDTRITAYTNVYFDTPDHAFFTRHVTGRPERQKIRLRTYGSTGNTFLEVKSKTRKGRTVKKRVEYPSETQILNESAKEFIRGHSAVDPETLIPVICNSFKRITLIGFDNPERITIDIDISFTAKNGKTSGLPLVAVLELKTEGKQQNSLFSRILRQMSIYPKGFSKYCVGCALLLDLPLRNILKPKLLLLNKIENEYTGSLRA